MQAYSDPKRENDPHALPDVEIFCEDAMECDACGNTFPDSAETPLYCPACGKQTRAACSQRQVWWWWPCFPGCLPDGDPSGPFATEAEALADAQSGSDDD